MFLDPKRAWKTASGLWGRPHPIFLYHKPTARCDCRCLFCDFWKDPPKDDDVLPTPQIFDLLERSARAGIVYYGLWGGEPLLAQALPEWLARARNLGMATTICTAGVRLGERAAELAPLVDQLMVSIEAVGERHDRVRRVPGLFAKAVAGIDEYRGRGGGGAGIWSNLSRENFDQVRPLASLAREHGVVIEFCPAYRYEGYNENILLSDEERKEVFSEIIDLKRQGFPISNPVSALELMRDAAPFTCNIPRLSINVDHAGTVFACEPRFIPGLKPYGNIADLDLAGLASSPAYLENIKRLGACNVCLLPCVANMANNLILQAARRFANRLVYSFRRRSVTVSGR